MASITPPPTRAVQSDAPRTGNPEDLSPPPSTSFNRRGTSGTPGAPVIGSEKTEDPTALNAAMQPQNAARAAINAARFASAKPVDTGSVGSLGPLFNAVSSRKQEGGSRKRRARKSKSKSKKSKSKKNVRRN